MCESVLCARRRERGGQRGGGEERERGRV